MVFTGLPSTYLVRLGAAPAPSGGETLVGEGQELPDQGTTVVHRLEPLDRGGPQAHGVKRGVDHVSGPQVPLGMGLTREGYIALPFVAALSGAGGCAIPGFSGGVVDARRGKAVDVSVEICSLKCQRGDNYGQAAEARFEVG